MQIIYRSTAGLMTEKYRVKYEWVAKLVCWWCNQREWDRRAAWWFEEESVIKSYADATQDK